MEAVAAWPHSALGVPDWATWRTGTVYRVVAAVLNAIYEGTL